LLAWHGGCRHGMAYMLSASHGSEAVAMARRSVASRVVLCMVCSDMLWQVLACNGMA
jgi:hypothetical protein